MADEWDNVAERGGTAETDLIWDRKNPLIGDLLSVSKDVGPNKSMMYIVGGDDGQAYGVWGAHDLDAKMDGVEINSRVRIEALGKKPTKGGREVMEYSVKSIPPKQPDAAPATVPQPEGQAVDLKDTPFNG